MACDFKIECALVIQKWRLTPLLHGFGYWHLAPEVLNEQLNSKLCTTHIR